MAHRVQTDPTISASRAVVVGVTGRMARGAFGVNAASGSVRARALGNEGLTRQIKCVVGIHYVDGRSSPRVGKWLWFSSGLFHVGPTVRSCVGDHDLWRGNPILDVYPG